MSRNRSPFGARRPVDPHGVDRRQQTAAVRIAHSFRAGLGCFLVLALIAGSLAAGDDPVPDQSEPPVRLKKKVKPQPEAAPNQRPEESPKKEPLPKPTEPPPKSGEPKEDPEPSIQDLQEKIREITNRVAKNMSQADERLQKNDPGETTQQTQSDIVRDLDELIEQTQRQQQQQQAQSNSSPSSQGQRNQQGRRNRGQQDPASGNRPPQNQNAQANNQSGNNPRGGQSSQEGMNKIADLYKDIWGHLPETLRQEMDQYSREQFMAKYGDLLKQYYATIAEKGRNKEDR
jgi:hypothetical protein